MTNYRLDVYDYANKLKYVLTDFSALAYTRRVNNPGIVQFSIRGDHPLLSTIADKWQIEVWRKPDDTDTWGREITGLYRLLDWTYGEQSRASFLCNGLMSMLKWRIIAWHAGEADRTKFDGVKAETVANTLVKYNATASATTGAGRLRDGHIDGLTVETDGTEGNTLDWFCAYDNLLESLQNLAKVGGGDFDLVKTSASAWQWRWYTGQLGTDRSATVTFAMERGNMANPIYRDNRTQECTAAIVGGQGIDTSRAIVIRTGTNYHVDTNNIEMFVGATDVDTTEGLNARGDQKLKEAEAIKSFTFDVLQTTSCMYGTHYTLGDLTTAVNPYNGASYTVKIQAVTVSTEEDGSEKIEVEVSSPLEAGGFYGTGINAEILHIANKLGQRLSYLEKLEY